MGGSLYRIELLLIGAVLLLGAALAAAVDFPLPNMVATTESEGAGQLVAQGMAAPMSALHATSVATGVALGEARALLEAHRRPSFAGAGFILLAAVAVAVLRRWGVRRTLASAHVGCAGRAGQWPAKLRAAWRRAKERVKHLGAHVGAPLGTCAGRVREAVHVAVGRLRDPARTAAAVRAAGAPALANPSVHPQDSGVDGAHLAASSSAPGALRTHAAEPTWTPEDAARLVAAALAAEWTRLGLRSTVRRLDAEAGEAAATVTVAIEVNISDQDALRTLPERVVQTHDGWVARWRRDALVVTVPPSEASIATGPLLAPVLRHGRGVGRVCALPLGWPAADTSAAPAHLALYGDAAPHMLSACLVSLLYAHPPAELALAILDDGQVSPLFADAPHLIRAPGSPRATTAALQRGIRRGWQRGALRPLILALVEPDEGLLTDLAALVAQTRRQAGIPLHLIIAQRRLLPAGRELYALLPACVGTGGQGDARLLPGGRQPARGARLIAGAGRLDGQPITLDEGQTRAAVMALPPAYTGLPPVLWDTPVSPAPVRASQPPLQLSEPMVPTTSELARRLGSAVAGQAPGEAVPQPALARADALPTRGLLPPERLEPFARRLLTDPAVVSATPPGVTRGRIAALLPAEERGRAAALMAWLDAAGVLEDPRDETLRWREPRRLRSDDHEWVAARLRCTTPDTDSV